MRIRFRHARRKKGKSSIVESDLIVRRHEDWDESELATDKRWAVFRTAKHVFALAVEDGGK